MVRASHLSSECCGFDPHLGSESFSEYRAWRSFISLKIYPGSHVSQTINCKSGLNPCDGLLDQPNTPMVSLGIDHPQRFLWRRVRTELLMKPSLFEQKITTSEEIMKKKQEKTQKWKNILWHSCERPVTITKGRYRQNQTWRIQQRPRMEEGNHNQNQHFQILWCCCWAEGAETKQNSVEEREKHQSKESHSYMHKELAQNKHKQQETIQSYNERHESNCGD